MLTQIFTHTTHLLCTNTATHALHTFSTCKQADTCTHTVTSKTGAINPGP